AQSAEVAALVQGATQSMSAVKLKTATVCLLVLGLCAAGLVARARQPLADRQANKEPPAVKEQQPAAAPAKGEAKDSVTVRGRVVDPEGKPVAGVKLYLAKTTHDGRALSQHATSGPDGRFR